MKVLAQMIVVLDAPRFNIVNVFKHRKLSLSLVEREVAIWLVPSLYNDLDSV
jgi:hypothetical protein